MAEPFTGLLSWSGISSACAALGQAGLALPPVKEWLGGCKNRLVQGWMLPDNRNFVRTIRTAHLAALDYVKRQHSEVIESANFEIGPDEHSFNLCVAGFLAQRLKILQESAIDIEALTEADITHAVDDLLQPVQRESLTAHASTARKAAESRALAELEADAGFPAPALFRRLFHGEGRSGWHDAFALMRHVLEVKATASDLKGLMEGRFDQLEANITKILETLAQKQGVPTAEVRGFIEQFGHTGLSDFQIIEQANKVFASIAAQYDRPRDPTNNGGDLEALLGSVDQAWKAEGTDVAVALLEKGIRDGSEALEDQKRRQRMLLKRRYELLTAAYRHGEALTSLRAMHVLDTTDSWSLIEAGDIQMRIGNLGAALSSFEQALLIEKQANDQRREALCLNRIGNVRSAQGDLSGALKAFEDGLAIARKLTDRDPANTQWQRDLSVSYEKIGDVLEEQGKIAEALAHYHQSLPIAERLATLDGTNATWKQDVVITRRRIDQLEAKLERR